MNIEWIDARVKSPEANQKVVCVEVGGIAVFAQHRPEHDTYRWDCDTYGMREEDVLYWHPILPVPELPE